MIYLKSINWTDDALIDRRAVRKRLFPLDIEFKDSITVIVGENGTGKTRLLKNIDKKAKILDEMRARELNGKPSSKITISNGKDMCHLITIDDTTNITLNIDSAMQYTRILNYNVEPLYRDTYSGDVLQLARHWMSNGKTKDILIDRIKNYANRLRRDNKYAVLLLDELDNSLDYKKQRKFARILKQSSEVMQFIVVTHNIPFISQFKEVFDIEAKQYVKTKDYLNKVLK